MSYPRYPKYKDSGVEWLGEVPEGWGVKRLSTFFNERRERVTDSDFAPLSVGKFGVAPQIETAAKTDAGDNRKLVRVGDCVINSRSDRKGAAGASGLEGSVSLIYIVLNLLENISSNFAHYLLRSIPFQEEFYRYGKGIVADLWSTNYSEMKNIILAIPDIQEQQTIAAFLDRETTKIDVLIAEQEKLATLLQEKRQAVISHAVTKGLNPDAPMKDSGVEWLGEVPEGWEICSIKYHTRVGNGSTPNRDNPDYWADEGYPWLNSSVVNLETVTTAERFVTPLALKECHLPIIEPPAVLVGITGQGKTRGMATLLMFEATINQHLVYLKPNENKLSVLFLLFALKMAYEHLRIESEGAGSTKGAITCEQLERFIIPVPSIQEQGEIVSFLNTETVKIDALITESRKAVELLKERRSALISAAVTGKIDVRNIPLQEAV